VLEAVSRVAPTRQRLIWQSSTAASRDNENGSDVHLSAFGPPTDRDHAQALNELGQAGVVDDAAFYGSRVGAHGRGRRLIGTHGVPLEVMRPIMDEPDMFW
jgi:hypothetical protein